jgi:hypothetical protein
MKLVAAVLLAFVASIYAHSISRIPPAWNPNPSKTAQCGGGRPGPVVMNLYVGQTQDFTWEVVAGDGAGAVTIRLDPSGGSFVGGNFATLERTDNIVPQGVGTFKFSAKVPDVTCTGTDGTCTLQMFSTSNWYSCATVKVIRSTNGTGTTTQPTLPTTCNVASGLKFCTWMNGQNVVVPPGQISPLTLDWAVQNAYNSYLQNTLVFKNPNHPQCAGWFQKLICGLNFQPCTAGGLPGGCNQACLNTNAYCETTDVHLSLYNCTKFPNTVADLTGNCSGANSIKVSPVVVLIAALLSVIAFVF